MNLHVPEMLLDTGLDVACSSISAGETNTSIDWYFTVVTLGERKGVCGGGAGGENDQEIRKETTCQRCFQMASPPALEPHEIISPSCSGSHCVFS